MIFFILLGIMLYKASLKRENTNNKKLRSQPLLINEKEWFDNVNKERNEIVSCRKTKLVGFLINNDSDTYVICSHGYHGSYREFSFQTRKFVDEFGFNVLNYSQRAHGESEGKYSTMGFLEKEDLKNWIDYILLLNKNAKIILYGWSMGAATILSYLGKYKNEHIICAITDAGYSSLKEEFLYVAKKTIKLPTRYSLNALDFVMKIRCGFSLKDVNIAANLENNFTPILFIHGEDDTFVPFYMQKILYENDAGEKEKISFPKSEHVQSLTNYPQEYMEKVKNFINKYSCN